MTTPNLVVRTNPRLRAFLIAKAAEDSRSLSSLVIKVLSDWAHEHGFEKAEVVSNGD